ncbi:hypothetical protein TPB0596_42610 [Tsukamurella pulmonis]|uniref:hypothetical protein n=1 Tax=Tsukamurella pulmonis TaxID=47312 RepID=UPI001EE08152|nr:hypothetical protein [Tsukamurella pulmonis]BDD84498.1 hypothetical protein TPB0596_42610 [Tsukamurella pulmonis]
MVSHKDCNHPKTTEARRACRAGEAPKKWTSSSSAKRSTKAETDQVAREQKAQAAARERSRWRKTLPAIEGARYVKLSGKHLTEKDFLNLPEGFIEMEPLVQIPYHVEFEYIGIDESGQLVRSLHLDDLAGDVGDPVLKGVPIGRLKRK